MNLKTFKELINSISEDYDNYCVVIETSNNTLGPTPCSEVEGIGIGFDWDMNEIIIKPKDKLIK